MKLIMKWRDPDWWFWPVTMVLILAGLTFWPLGLLAAVWVNALQVVYFAVWKRSVIAFPTQVRIVFFALVGLAYFDPTQILFVFLAVGSAMVAFLDRCVIARVIIHLPWNQHLKTK